MSRWIEKPLSEVCEINPKNNGAEKLRPLTCVSFVPMAAVDEVSGTIVSAELRKVVDCMKGYTAFKDGDVLFAKITPCMENGKAVIARNLVEGCGFGSTEFHVLRPKPGILPDWVFSFIRQPSFRHQAKANFTGTAGQQRVSSDFFRTVLIPVPPLPEQERIMRILDEAEALRRLRTRTDSRTIELLPSLFEETFGRHIYSPPVVVSINGLSAPKGWRWVRLTDVARLATGHTPSRQVPSYWGGNLPWISLSDIRALDGKVALTASEFVTEEGIRHSSAVKLPKGTVCFSRTASVGFVTVMGTEMATSQDFVNWVCGDDLDPMFLMCALIQAREHLRSLASGSTHKTIYFPTVQQFCTILPPIALQREFAAQFREVCALEEVQTSSQQRLDDLFQSLLHRAFQGEL